MGKKPATKRTSAHSKRSARRAAHSPGATESELVTVVQAARELGISRIAVYQAIDAGRLASVEVLGKIGIPRDAVERYRPDAAKQRAGLSRTAKS